MVVASPSPSPVVLRRKGTAFGIPTVDLYDDNNEENRRKISEQMVRACEDYGFFKVVNHGVANKVIARMEREGVDFFSRPVPQKRRAGPASPFGYGCKNIGFNGDKGELEYILLEANPLSLSQRSNSFSNNPSSFSSAANDYVSEVKKLACNILELVGEGIWMEDKCIFSKLIHDSQNDSCFRINHYPQWDTSVLSKSRVGFGEHTDPQILTILRSNEVSGLQICSHDGFWIPVPPDPNHFFVFVGDAFQALTNGRFRSVRHRAMAINSCKPRMSMMYFAAPPLDAWITAPPTINNLTTNIYRPFTWAHFKQTVYSLRLADDRLDHFKNHTH